MRFDLRARHKVPPSCLHADECACSLTAVGMTTLYLLSVETVYRSMLIDVSEEL